MNCPSDVAFELAEILKWGLLRIRTCGQQGDARRCVHESDHIHNLPGLLVDYAPQLLAFYWRTERPLLIKQIGESECKAFERAWAQLKPLVDRECAGHDVGPTQPMPTASNDVAAVK